MERMFSTNEDGKFAVCCVPDVLASNGQTVA